MNNNGMGLKIYGPHIPWPIEYLRKNFFIKQFYK